MKIDYDILKRICFARIKDFKGFGKVTNTKDGLYIHKDNNSKILGVAHLDTVLSTRHFYVNKIGNDEMILNAQLDDRLGVYVLTSLLPSLGLNFDVLLTEGEETGRSTSQYFESDKYNWIFSFDRHGDDVVLYQYSDENWESVIKSSGFKIGIGSFSDIAFMDSLGVMGLNIGTGYEGEHSKMSYASTRILKKQVHRFIDFYHKNKDIKYPYELASSKQAYYHYSYRGSQYWNSWGEYDNLYCYLCAKHTGTNQITDDIWLCNSCMQDAELCAVCQDVKYSFELADGICEDCLNTKE